MSQIRPRRDYLGPFRVAVNGIVFTFKTQPNMRFHLYSVALVMLIGILVDLGMREMLVLLFTISLVLVAEMFNSAIEATVDLVSPNYHPLAKFAKDIAAGAVLITTMCAVVVALMLMLGENRWEAIKVNLTSEGLGLGFVPRLFFGLVVLFAVVLIGKGLGRRGRVLQGGQVSGHAAYGFFLAVSSAFVSGNVLASSIAVFLAAIIAQSRYEAKIHSLAELSLGAVIGTVLALLIFGVMPR